MKKIISISSVLLLTGVVFTSVTFAGDGAQSPVPKGVIQSLVDGKDFYSGGMQMKGSPNFFLSTHGSPDITKRGAILRSMILPGWGERYLGADRASGYFFTNEAGLWLSILGMNRYGNWRKEDYKAYAAAHAGVDNTGKLDRYYVNVSNYSNIRDFNEAKRRNRTPSKVYPETPANSWEWDSEESRMEYDSLRLQSEKAGVAITFISGALVVNRLLSIIDVIYKYNKSVGGETATATLKTLPNRDGTLMLTLSASF